MSDKRVQKYFENMPYGDSAKSSEIHGKDNKRIIDGFITVLAQRYDEALANGDKESAQEYSGIIKKISQDLDNLKEIKKEFAVNYGGGIGGKNMFSNYTNLNWDRSFFIEDGKISFDENLTPVLSVQMPNGEIHTKRIEDITESWVVKGGEEQQYMQMQQDASKQRNTIGKTLDFDIDWAVDNLLVSNDAWKSFVSDKIGGRYFLQDYVVENEQDIINGNIPSEMLHPDSFNPEFDTRLHTYYSNRLKKSFDPNFETPKERQEAEALMAKTQTNNENTQA